MGSDDTGGNWEGRGSGCSRPATSPGGRPPGRRHGIGFGASRSCVSAYSTTLTGIPHVQTCESATRVPDPCKRPPTHPRLTCHHLGNPWGIDHVRGTGRWDARGARRAASRHIWTSADTARAGYSRISPRAALRIASAAIVAMPPAAATAPSASTDPPWPSASSMACVPSRTSAATTDLW
jgi:hypothetical protein